jgi:hypothetical protein
MLTGLASLGSAAVIPVFSTGGGSTTDGFADPNWTYTNSSNVTSAALVAGNPGVDFFSGSCCGGGPWQANTTASAWVVDNISNSSSGGDPLTFQTTFSMAGLDPTTASITLLWGIDDGGDLYFNGNLISSLPGQNATHWQGPLTSVTINSGFLAGNNTIQAVLTDNDNAFDGFRLEVTDATATAVATTPEPGSMLLAFAGLGMLVPIASRLRRC